MEFSIWLLGPGWSNENDIYFKNSRNIEPHQKVCHFSGSLHRCQSHLDESRLNFSRTIKSYMYVSFAGEFRSKILLVRICTKSVYLSYLKFDIKEKKSVKSDKILISRRVRRILLFFQVRIQKVHWELATEQSCIHIEITSSKISSLVSILELADWSGFVNLMKIQLSWAAELSRWRPCAI